MSHSYRKLMLKLYTCAYEERKSMDNTFPIKAIWENEMKVFAVLQNSEQSCPIYSTLSLYFLFLTFLFLPSSLSILTLSSFRFIRLFFIFLSVSHTTHFVYFYLFFFPVFLCFLLIYSPLFSTCISLSQLCSLPYFFL